MFFKTAFIIAASLSTLVSCSPVSTSPSELDNSIAPGAKVLSTRAVVGPISPPQAGLRQLAYINALSSTAVTAELPATVTIIVNFNYRVDFKYYFVGTSYGETRMRFWIENLLEIPSVALTLHDVTTNKDFRVTNLNDQEQELPAHLVVPGHKFSIRQK